MNEKYEKLKQYLKSLGSVAIAFSGGVDSTFLLKVSHEVLGGETAAVTVRSPLFPAHETAEAEAFCEREGIRQLVLDIDQLSVEGFADNPKDRCYICKSEMLKRMRAAALNIGIPNLAEGSNADDEGDYRPGLAAVTEQGVLSPLRCVGLSKGEIRALSREMGLSCWDKPSFACLASRFAYGEPLTLERIAMVDKAERLLSDLGFSQYRVRVHGSIARIEIIKDEFPEMLERSTIVYDYLKSLGFSYVSMDLGGYRSGSMNDGILAE